MDKLQVIRAVKKLVSEGELEAALAQLVTALETEKPLEELYQSAIESQSFYQRTKRDESLSTISFDNAKLNYSQVTRQILVILDDWEEGRTSSSNNNGQKPVTNNNRIWIWIAAGALVLAAAAFFVIYNINNQKKKDEAQAQAQAAQSCPSFEPKSIFNILLFRYFPLGGNKTALGTHQAVRRRLGELIANYNLDVDLDFYKDNGDDNLLPQDLSDAVNIAKNCNAKLAIFGTEEIRPDAATIITTQYRFLDIGEQFKFSRLRINENAEIDTVTSISSIATSGVITGNIEQSILLVFGVVTLETARNETDKKAIDLYKKTIELLEQVQPADSASFLLKNMALQEAYLKTGQTDNQIAALDNVLEKHPNYKFALDNRSALLFEKGDYLAALQDLNTQVQLNPQDTSTLTRRGVVNLKVENLEEARQDFKEVQKKNPEDSSIRKQINITERKIIEKWTEKKNAEEQLKVNPTDPQALTTKANATKSLGQYDEAIRAAEALIEQEPKNVRAYVTLIQIYTAMNEPEKVEEAKQRLLKAASKAKIIKEAPKQIRTLLQRDTIARPK